MTPINLFHFFAGAVGTKCTFPSGSNFFSFPTWYQYLNGVWAHPAGNNAASATLVCNPSLQSIADIWLIVAAIIEILLRIAAIGAVAMVIYGGVSYQTSQGEPDKTARARDTIINALIGLAIAISAAAIIQFIAGSIS